ncbi:hypothetical protein [Methylobacterium oxalidis]|uniref:Uncharacterized protein n=1 Tax=Methylobacterium oxalidis TaxID=944322 RepID=A0A512J4K2_9HYPH|nr:hypothetical protein [Methylobacterium oxalidis]GEP04840.1 hypothetical protein MOX02_28780 [Methylobacterium oxalidis]GJE30532.1 hypothetical protein LDDCCGHA_0700 [Methylobacterium oxalidis]GLS63665.1 hypothetical protein GCM10007888_20460 [Methylobacterium oxalidis]
MTIANLSKRLEKIEAARHVGAPKGLVSFVPLTDEEEADAKRNWRQWVADGRAKLQWGCIVIPAPKLTVEEWVAETTKYRGEPVH